MAKKKMKKKPIFDKVGLVFRNPVRVDIMKELSEEVQRPIDIAENIDIQKQKLNYHLKALKRGGLVKTHTEKLSDIDLPEKRGIRVNGLSDNGKLKVSYGVELTKNGKDLVNQFIAPLYEDERDKKIKKNEKEDD
jgi:DNA-binding transcriptional ArsR family regulator